MKNTRFVIAGIPSWDIARPRGLSLILKLECPVVTEEGSRLMRLLPSRARPSIASCKNLPTVPKVDTEDTTLPERLTGRIVLMNVRPRIEEVAEEMNLSLSLPDNVDCLCKVMDSVPLRSMEGWLGWLVYRFDVMRWEVDLRIPLSLEEGDAIFTTSTDAHDTPNRSSSPASYHGKVLDFDNNILDM